MHQKLNVKSFQPTPEAIVYVNVDKENTIYADNMDYNKYEGTLAVVEYTRTASSEIIIISSQDINQIGDSVCVFNRDLSEAYNRHELSMNTEQHMTMVVKEAKMVYWTDSVEMLNSTEKMFDFYGIQYSKHFHQRDLGDLLNLDKYHDFRICKAEDTDNIREWHEKTLAEQDRKAKLALQEVERKKLLKAEKDNLNAHIEPVKDSFNEVMKSVDEVLKRTKDTELDENRGKETDH